MTNSGTDPFVSGLASALEESLAGYTDGGRLITARTRKLIEGERRTVAVLFLDLVGFTGLGETLDHEVLHELLSSVMGFLSSVVESFGGYVDKFEGDRLMALFGAVSAGENDSARAVGCALRMIDILEEVGPVLPDGGRITARVGIHSGQVTVAPDPTGHTTATGSTVNLASRMEELAEAGTVSVSDSVMHQCGELFSFRLMGAFDVRGISSPVPVNVVLGPGRLRLERWERSARLRDSPLVDRDAERAVLKGYLDEVRREPGSRLLVRIRGEAGLGKSRLLHHLITEAEGMTVLHGHARHYSQTPFWIWIDLLREHLGTGNDSFEDIRHRLRALADGCPDRRLAAKVEEEASRIAGLLSLTRGGRDLTENGSQGMVVAIRLLLDALAADGDMLVALEDTHWMDEPSRRVLKMFADSGGADSGTLVVATERPGGEMGIIPERSWRTIELRPLENAEISRISEHLLSEEEVSPVLSGALREFLSRGSRGNPFYVEELVLGLLEKGAIQRGEDGSWKLAGPPESMVLPTSVHALVQSRLDVLTRIERRLLQVASVIGPYFREPVLDLVRSRLGMGSEDDGTVEGLVEKGFLLKDGKGGIRFRHDLVQSSVYETVLKHNRRIVHGLTAEACDELYPEESDALAPVIYDHWKHAGNRQKKVQWGAKALLMALESEQNDTILKIADELLLMVGPDSSEDEWDIRARAMLARQNALARMGDISAGIRVVDILMNEARSRGRLGYEAAAIRYRCIFLNELGQLDGLEAEYRVALRKAEDAGDRDLAGRVLASMGNYYSDMDRNEAALDHYDEACRIFTGQGLLNELATLYSNRANLYMKLDRKEEAEENYRNSIEILRGTGRRSSLGYALNGLAILKAKKGALDEARELFEEALDYQMDIGNKPIQTMIINNLGVLTRMQGDFQRSLRYRKMALEIAGLSGSVRSKGIALVNLGNIHRLMKENDKALEYSGRSLEVASGARDSLTVCHALSVMGMTRLQMGDESGGIDCYRKALAIVEEHSIMPGVVDDFDDLMEMLRDRGMEHGVPSNWKDRGPEN